MAAKLEATFAVVRIVRELVHEFVAQPELKDGNSRYTDKLRELVALLNSKYSRRTIPGKYSVHGHGLDGCMVLMHC